MNTSSRIHFGSKNESVIVIKNGREFVVEVTLQKNVWSIHTPVVEIDSERKIQISSDVEGALSDQILIEVSNYLKEVKWLGLFRRKYMVEVVEPD